MLQPLGVECTYLHNAPLGLFVYNARVRATDVRASLDERVAKALSDGCCQPKK